MDNIFTYRGQNVDELSADQMRDALKQCIHELEQERRYKHTENIGQVHVIQYASGSALQSGGGYGGSGTLKPGLGPENTSQNSSHTPNLNCQCESCMRHLY